MPATDRYTTLTNSPLGAADQPPRAADPAACSSATSPESPSSTGPVVLGGARGGRLGEPAARGPALDRGGGDHRRRSPPRASAPAALIYDASGIDEPARLRSLYEFFHPLIYNLAATAA